MSVRNVEDLECNYKRGYAIPRLYLFAVVGPILRAKRFTSKRIGNVSIIMVKIHGTIYCAINNVIARSSRTFGTCFIQQPLGTRKESRKHVNRRNHRNRLSEIEKFLMYFIILLSS